MSTKRDRTIGITGVCWTLSRYLESLLEDVDAGTSKASTNYRKGATVRKGIYESTNKGSFPILAFTGTERAEAEGVIVMTVYLERSHAPYSWKPLAVTYLIVGTLVLAVVVGMSLLKESTVEIINGVAFATDIPGLDRGAKADASQWEERPRQGFMGWVRLVPVKVNSESKTETLSEIYSLGRQNQYGSALPKSYSPVFSESDLMRRMRRCGGIAYYRFCNLDGVYLTFVDEEL